MFSSSARTHNPHDPIANGTVKTAGLVWRRFSFMLVTLSCLIPSLEKHASESGQFLSRTPCRDWSLSVRRWPESLPAWQGKTGSARRFMAYSLLAGGGYTNTRLHLLQSRHWLLPSPWYFMRKMDFRPVFPEDNFPSSRSKVATDFALKQSR